MLTQADVVVAAEQLVEEPSCGEVRPAMLRVQPLEEAGGLFASAVTSFCLEKKHALEALSVDLADGCRVNLLAEFRAGLFFLSRTRLLSSD